MNDRRDGTMRNALRPAPEQHSTPIEPEPIGWDYTPLHARVLTHVFAGRYDRTLASGRRAIPGSTLAIHAWRITAGTERQALSTSLRRCLRDAKAPTSRPWSTRISIDRNNIRSAERLVGAVIERLDAQRPVSACGMAKLRVLLAEGHGPVYRYGRGDLQVRLAAVLAVL